jgi:site-specific DNA-methyltransferase (adenine-specific)
MKNTPSVERTVIRFPPKFLNQVTCGDSLTLLKRMPDDCVDVVVTSPPYNLKNSTGNGFRATGKYGKWKNAALHHGYEGYGDNMPHSEYVQWQHCCLAEMFRVIKDTGAIFYNHKWRVQAGLLQDRADIVAGFPVRQIIIWKRAGGINFNKGYFLPTYEVIYLIAKPKFVLTLKANALTDVWEFKQEMNNGHPAPFPLDLPLRCIGASPGEVVLDPFLGSGTTAVAALQLGRTFIGFEKSQVYCDLARARINGSRPLLPS